MCCTTICAKLVASLSLFAIAQELSLSHSHPHHFIMANSTLFQPLIFGFLSAFVWGTYGWYIRDIPIIIPNAIGIVLCTIQLVLYAYYAQVKEEPAGVASSVAGNAVKIAGRGSNGRYSVVPKSLGLGDLSPRISRARLRSPHSPAREQRSMTP